MRPLSILILLSLFSSQAVAKELFVSAGSGNDSVSYAQNDQARPWRTLGRATWGSTSIASPNTSEAARAGDTVNVAAGTYNTSAATNSRYTPIYNPVNSGAPGAYIRFVAQGQVYLRSSDSSGTQPIIGTLDRSYVVWDGFIVDEAFVPTRADTGPVVVWGSNNVIIQNLHVTGVPQAWGDNHGGIRIENSGDVTIRGNLVERFDESHGGGITTYSARGLIVENNEIRNCSDGIFIKGADNSAVTIRYNLVVNNKNGIMFGSVGIDGRPSFVYQNVILDSTLGGVIFIGYDNRTPAHVTVANNVIDGTTRSGDGGGILLRPGYSGYRDLAFANNIVTDANAGVTAWGTELSAISFRNNNYFNNNRVAYVGYSDLSLASWQSTYGKDTTGTQTVDPRFVGGGDYKLATNSALIGAGVDVLDLNRNGSTTDAIPMGAYVTGSEVIGRNASSSSITPAPPQNLSVE